MLADQFLDAAASARNATALDDISRLTWHAHSEGCLIDADAEAISAALQARRAALARPIAVSHKKPLFGPAKPHPRSSDRQASLERRRRQAMSGAVPAKIAASFTLGELAVLTVVAREVQRRGWACALPLDAIAALAGVSRSTTQNALRQARRLGLLEVKERRRRGLPSLTNVLKVISPEWISWLKLSGDGRGFKKSNPTVSHFPSMGRTGDKASKEASPTGAPSQFMICSTKGFPFLK